MIKLRDLIFEQSAGEEAKKRGLQSIGFGRYVDPKDPKKVVAKSVGGKLVRVGMRGEPQKSDEPSEKPETAGDVDEIEERRDARFSVDDPQAKATLTSYMKEIGVKFKNKAQYSRFMNRATDVMSAAKREFARTDIELRQSAKNLSAAIQHEFKLDKKTARGVTTAAARLVRAITPNNKERPGRDRDEGANPYQPDEDAEITIASNRLL